MDAVIEIYSISDLHLDRISEEDFICLSNNWPKSKSIVIIVGDTVRPSILEKPPFNQTRNLLFPGNHDKDASQEVISYDLVDVAIVGGMGFNYRDTPWAGSHLLRTHSDPHPFVDNLEKELSLYTHLPEVILAIHFPPIYYSQDGTAVLEPNIKRLLLENKNIIAVLTGHVHGTMFKLPDSYPLQDGRVVPFIDVTAYSTGYNPIFIWKRKRKRTK